MEVLMNPNIAYILLVAGSFLVLMAIIIPGTGMPEVGALFCIVLAAYAVYHLSFNWWALVLMVASMLPFSLSLRKPYSGFWLALAILGLTIGSVFFFPAEKGWISVNPLLAAVTSALYAAFVWMAARKVIQVVRTKPMHDLSSLIGQTGEAKTDVRAEGSVQVAGELWSAYSEKPIRAGSLVQVIGREGFILNVESIAGQKS
jgi:membrane-bound serine protease (ClpP class)